MILSVNGQRFVDPVRCYYCHAPEAPEAILLRHTARLDDQGTTEGSVPLCLPCWNRLTFTRWLIEHCRMSEWDLAIPPLWDGWDRWREMWPEAS